VKAIAQRIAEKTFEFLDGKDIKEWLEKMGCKCEWNNSVLFINGSVRTAIYRSLDPINTYVCLSMALFGPYWVYVCGGGLDIIKREWARRLRNESSNKRIWNSLS